MRRFQDYHPTYAANLVPVIPFDAALSAQTTIKAKDRGKVPGVQGYDGNWSGFNWRALTPADVARKYANWQTMGAGIGFRGGHEGIVGLDFDITDRSDADAALEMITEAFGTVPIRRVKHRDHVKFLALIRVVDQFGEPVMVPSTDMAFTQSDGEAGKIQVLSIGRYFNVHGIHPLRLTPYVWDTDPADAPVPDIAQAAFKAGLQALRETFRAEQSFSDAFNDRVVGEIGTEDEVRELLALVPNDDSFDAYDRFQAMGRVLWGATGGSSLGWELWLKWCGQQGQEQPDKPQDMWDSFRGSRNGIERLRVWANRRDPWGRAEAVFGDVPIPDDVLQELDDSVDFLNGSIMVCGRDNCFLVGPSLTFHTKAGFNDWYAAEAKSLRKVFGDKRLQPAGIFAKYSTNKAEKMTLWPCKPRIFYDRDGVKVVNLWVEPPRPTRGQPVRQDVVDRWRELSAFVLGSEKTADLWIKWHAYLLQFPDRKPGWHWLVQSTQGIGKDIMLSPCAAGHGRYFTKVNAAALSERFNGYAESRLVEVSEMKMMSGSHDAYNRLKDITDQGDEISIERKGRDAFMVFNGVCLVLFSNESQPVYLDTHDRRFYVVSNMDAKPKSPQWYAETAKLLREGWGSIQEYLYGLALSEADISTMEGRAPMTQAKADLIAASVPEWASALAEYIEETKSGMHSPLATATDIATRLSKTWGIKQRMLRYGDLIAAGAIPFQPEKDNPNKADNYAGKGKFWVLVKEWLDPETGTVFDIRADLQSDGGKANLYRRFIADDPDDLKPREVRTIRRKDDLTN